jgi:hypothetical protein
VRFYIQMILCDIGCLNIPNDHNGTTKACLSW